MPLGGALGPSSIARPLISAHRANLAWDDSETQAKVLGVLDEVPFAWFRDGLRAANAGDDADHPEDSAAARAAIYKQIQDQGKSILLLVNIHYSDFDEGLDARAYIDDTNFEALCGFNGALPLSGVNLTKYEARLRAHCTALKAAGVRGEAFEIGNELDYVCYNGDLSLDSTILDAALDAHARAYARILGVAERVIHEYFPEALIVSYGFANFRDHSGDPTFPAIDNPGKLLAALADIDGVNYLDRIDVFAAHIYPSTSDNQYSMTLARLQKFFNDVGVDKPIWITEWGFRNDDYTSSNRYIAFVKFYHAMLSAVGLNVTNIFYHGIDDFGNKAIVDTDYAWLSEADFLFEYVGRTVPPVPTPPVLSAPLDAAAGFAGDLSVTTDTPAGTLYWVISQSATPPSAAQVKAGLDHLGAAADAAGSQAVSTTGSQAISPKPSLAPATTYYASFVQEDSDGQSDVVTGDGFTTFDAAMILVAGQSNARSYDTTGNDVPAELQGPDEYVQIWNTHTQAWEQYSPGSNSDTWTSGASTPQKWGPEAGFATAFRAAHPTTVLYIVKLAVDSTSLATQAGEDWNPANSGEAYDDMQGEVSAAIAAADGAGITLVANALLWMQGEQDAQDLSAGPAYGTNLDGFITAIRSDWGDSNTKVLLGRITPSSQWATAGSSVRAFQARVARDTTGVQAIDTDGYTLAADSKHYIAASVQTLGADMFSAYAGTYTKIPPRFGSMAADKNASITLSNGNLTATGTGINSSALFVARSDQVLNGKCYIEFLIVAQGANLNVGVGKGVPTNQYWGQVSDSVGYAANGAVFKNASQIATLSTYTANDRVMIAFDTATGKVWFGKNGSWNGDPAAGTGEAATLSSSALDSYHRFGVTLRRATDSITLKALASEFAYTPPTGFAAI